MEILQTRVPKYQGGITTKMNRLVTIHQSNFLHLLMHGWNTKVGALKKGEEMQFTYKISALLQEELR